MRTEADIIGLSFLPNSRAVTGLLDIDGDRIHDGDIVHVRGVSTQDFEFAQVRRAHTPYSDFWVVVTANGVTTGIETTAPYNVRIVTEKETYPPSPYFVG